MSRTLWFRVSLAAIVAIGLVSILTDRSLWSVAPFCGALLGLSLVLGAGVGVAMGGMSAITHHSARAGVLLFRRIVVHTGVSGAVGISIGWLLGKLYDIATVHTVSEAFYIAGGERALILIVCWFLSLIAALISLRSCTTRPDKQNE